MLRNFVLIVVLIFMISCNSQKEAKKEMSNLEESALSEKISSFLNSKNFEVLESVKVIVEYEIKKNLIKGTKNEYSNKVFLKDTLESKIAEELLLLLKDDTSYNWSTTEKFVKFDPNRQFLFKNGSQKLVLLIDEEEGLLGFINLDGQKVIGLSANFQEFLEVL